MDIKILLDHHKIITGLNRQLEAVPLRAPEMEEGVLKELRMELHWNFLMRKNILYPKLKSFLSDVADTAVLEDLSQIVEESCDLIARSTTDLNLKGQLGELNTNFAELYSEEEHTCFRLMSKLNSDQINELNALIRDDKLNFDQLPQYQDALASVVQNPNGGEQKRIDLH